MNQTLQNTLLPVLLVIFPFLLISQNNILLSFEAENAGTGGSTPLDSVVVVNVDQNCDTTLFGDAPTLLIDLSTRVSNNKTFGFMSASPCPNPFSGSTAISFVSPQAERLRFILIDELGNTKMSVMQTIKPGQSIISIGTASRLSFLIISNDFINYSYKLINLSPLSRFSVSIKSSTRIIKSTATSGDFVFDLGDTLIMTGNATGFFEKTIYDSPVGDTAYTFAMQPILSLPSIITSSISNISFTTASGGGDVTDEGGTPVTERGVCWSVIQYPTLEDNFTIDGEGLGMFVSLLSGLDTNTVYYVRAYATNQAGTAYGNQIVFVTQAGIPCPGIPTIEYGGQTYNTVLIGEQCWTKENLNIGLMITDVEIPQDNGIIEKWCYNDNPANCAAYGGLYRWDEMMQYSTLSGSQGICPDGWHIPTDEELKIMEGTIDSQYPVGDPEWDLLGPRGIDAGLRAKSKTGWFNQGNGNNLSGYTAQPSGYRYVNGGFDEMGIGFYFWSSSEEGQSVAWIRNFRYFIDGSIRDNLSKNVGFPIRCLKD